MEKTILYYGNTGNVAKFIVFDYFQLINQTYLTLTIPILFQIFDNYSVFDIICLSLIFL